MSCNVAAAAATPAQQLLLLPPSLLVLLLLHNVNACTSDKLNLFVTSAAEAFCQALDGLRAGAISCKVLQSSK